MFSVQVEVQKYLDEYNSKVAEATRAAAKEAAETTARTLQNTSPKRGRGRGRGKYARGWTTKRVEDGVLTGYIVYNETRPGLTQNLEFGHVVRNQYGAWGRVRAIPHIASAADAGLQRFELSIRARLRK